MKQIKVEIRNTENAEMKMCYNTNSGADAKGFIAGVQTVLNVTLPNTRWEIEHVTKEVESGRTTTICVPWATR